MNGNIMQIYHFLCAVIVLATPSRAEQKATCSVPFIPNGNIQEGNVFNWTANRWESYRNVSVGTISSHNTTFLLVCDENHSFKGASRIRITCSNKKFSPDPVCLKKTCSVPLIPNGNVQEGNVFNWTANRWESYRNVSIGTLSSDGTTFLLVCDEDYSFNGAGASRIRITCLNKKFSPDPICLKTCSVPLISNGNIQEGDVFNWTANSWASYRNVPVGTLLSDNTTFLLVCDENHSFKGAGVSRILIKCSNTKFSPDPVCLITILCPLIDEKDVFNILYNNGRKIDSKATFSCKDINKKIVGHYYTKTCLTTGKWSGGSPECRATCAVPFIPNGNIQEGNVFNWTSKRWESYRNVSVGTLSSDDTTLLLVCDENHSFKGAGTSIIRITCSNKKFLPDPVCLRTTCSVPFIPNGNIQEGNVFNWTANHWESYRNVSVGTLSSDNTTFLLVCDKGHSFKGAGVASRVRITCSNGNFSPDPVCLKTILCPPIDEKDDFNIVYNNDRKVDSKAIFSCKDVNKKIVGGSYTKTCLTTGKWSGGSPECKRTCSVPLVPNGNIQERVGFSTSDWTPGWTPDLTTDLKSNLTPDWINKNVSLGSISSHNTALFLVCDEDYSNQEDGVSSIEITCSNGQWSPDPVCFKSMCPPIEEKDVFIVVYNNGRKINSTARFYCKDVNQEIVGGNNTWTCLPTGNWSGGIPECKVYQCAIKDLLELAPGILVPNSESEVGEMVPAGVELPLRCRGNLILVGSTKAKCGRNGKWRNRMHECISGCHLDPKSISSGLITDPDKLNFNFGEHVDLSCPLGMKLTSNVEILMCLGSTWSDEIPECQ